MIKIQAFAKLDLAIHIDPRKSKDDLYPVNYIDCQIDLTDELTFEKAQNLEIICRHPEVPTDKTNFIFQAASFLGEIASDRYPRTKVRSSLFFTRFGFHRWLERQGFLAQNKKSGAKITLVKNIPVKAGFGGGSADAAATIRGLCQLWDATLTQNQLTDLARQLGKDFYYSLHGGLCEVSSVGKNYQIKPLKSRLPQFWLVVIVPHEEKPGTGWMYKNLKPDKIGHDRQKLGKLKKAIESHNRPEILKNLHNDFEKSVSYYFPIIDKMKNDLIKLGAQSALMAGAGLSIVGFFESQKSAQKAKEKLAGGYKQILISHLRGEKTDVYSR